MFVTTMVLLVTTVPVIMVVSVFPTSDSQSAPAGQAGRGSIVDRRMLDNQETRDVRVDHASHPEHYSHHERAS